MRTKSPEISADLGLVQTPHEPLVLERLWAKCGQACFTGEWAATNYEVDKCTDSSAGKARRPFNMATFNNLIYACGGLQ